MSSDFIQDAFEASPLAQVLCHEGRVLLANRRAAELLGLRPGDPAPSWVSFGAGEVQIDDRIVSYRCSDTLVATRPCRSVAAWDATLLHQTLRSSRRLARERVVQERLDALGQMSAGVAHEFNNALQVVQISAALMAESDDENADVLLEATQRMASLIRQMRVFAGEGARPSQAADVEEVLRSVAALHLVEADVQGKLGRLSLGPSDLQQLLEEILDNALRFRRESVSLRAAPEHVQGDRAWALKLRPGTYVRISVTDDGPGMDERSVERAPEPFFTTSAPRNQGLGLAVVHGIAHRSGGAMKISSVVGQGTTVSVWLRQEPAAPKASPKAPRRLVRRVLLAEDDPGVRVLVRALLERHGFEVQACGDGAQALEVWDEQGPFDLVLSDIVMPEVGGFDLCDALKARDPGLTVILMTGFAPAEVPGHLEGVPLLRKPFRVGDLDDVLERLRLLAPSR